MGWSKGRIVFLFAVFALCFPGNVRGGVQTPGGDDAALQGQARADESGTVTLAELVRETLEKNPAIQAAQYAAAAKKATIESAQTLPDPVLGFQQMGDINPPGLQRGDPSSGRTYSVTQEVPFPGKLDLKGKIAATEFEAETWNQQQTRLQVIADLKVAYFNLYFVDHSITILEENKKLLQQFARTAETRYRVGQGIQQDVLKAHVEISKLIDRLTVLEQRRAATEEEINSLVYRPPGTPVGRPAEATKAEFSYPYNQLYELARSHYPLLQVQEQEIQRSQHRVELARREFYPDFALGLSAVERSGLSEMYGIMVNAKVPLYFWRKQQPELSSASMSLDSARKQRDNTMAQLNAKLRDLYLTATTSERLAELYRSGVIPQAQLALESAVAAYQVGNVDFLAVLDSFFTLLDYQIKYYEVFAEFHKALAQLEPYTGLELVK
ncbi:MAG TPA: TolC family protein [Syntrophobacteria bacterium]|nr:TolC family protein [Syntrophobacteria bacterium]